jgi:hypothetical protein
MKKDLPEKIAKEKRSEPRRAKLRNHRIEIKFIGNPIYQFRVIDVTTKGAGILIKDDSSFLNMIKKGQIFDVNFISPQGSSPSGMYSAKIKHITTAYKQEHKGHHLVGISILNKLGQT